MSSQSWLKKFHIQLQSVCFPPAITQRQIDEIDKFFNLGKDFISGI